MLKFVVLPVKCAGFSPTAAMLKVFSLSPTHFKQFICWNQLTTGKSLWRLTFVFKSVKYAGKYQHVRKDPVRVPPKRKLLYLNSNEMSTQNKIYNTSPAFCISFLRAIYHTFLWFIGSMNHAGCWTNTRRNCKSRAEGEWFTRFSSVIPTSQVVCWANKP